MGDFAIKPVTQILSWLIASTLVYLNLRMLVAEASGVFEAPGNLAWKILIILSGAGALALLIYITFSPFSASRNKKPPSRCTAKRKAWRHCLFPSSKNCRSPRLRQARRHHISACDWTG